MQDSVDHILIWHLADFNQASQQAKLQFIISIRFQDFLDSFYISTGVIAAGSHFLGPLIKRPGL